MKYSILFLLVIFLGLRSSGQNIDKIINASEVERMVRVLASDEMQGRKTFTPSLDSAAAFIAGEFKKTGLQYFKDLKGYQQSFSMQKTTPVITSGKINNTEVAPANIISVSTEEHLMVDQNSGYTEVVLDSAANLLSRAFALTNENKKYIVWVNKHHEKNFSRLSRLNRESFEPKAPVVFVLTDEKPPNYSFHIQNKITNTALANVIGVLPGKSRKDEYVIFSAHYDHIGIGKPDAKGDSIFNGANDNAAGTTAMMLLAEYFKKLGNNERTLVFVAFTAEEMGGFGSKYFSKSIDPDKAVAMFNIEMIGTESKWGTNSAFITGFEKSDFGTILQKNLVGSNFNFEPDPYPAQNLFYRSDNATLAALGVPAHTISTSKMDSEPNYHKQSDSIETLDLKNMAEIIKAIALSSQTIISGKDTPSRVEKR